MMVQARELQGGGGVKKNCKKGILLPHFCGSPAKIVRGKLSFSSEAQKA